MSATLADLCNLLGMKPGAFSPNQKITLTFVDGVLYEIGEFDPPLPPVIVTAERAV